MRPRSFLGGAQRFKPKESVSEVFVEFWPNELRADFERDSPPVLKTPLPAALRSPHQFSHRLKGCRRKCVLGNDNLSISTVATKSYVSPGLPGAGGDTRRWSS